MCVQKKIVIERTRDLIYLKICILPKIISPKHVLAKTPVIRCSPCYSAVSALLANPLPDRSNYSPIFHDICVASNSSVCKEHEFSLHIQNKRAAHSLLVFFSYESSMKFKIFHEKTHERHSWKFTFP